MTGSLVEMKGASEIASKRMTNKLAVENFWKTFTVSGHYFAKAKSKTYKQDQLNVLNKHYI